MMMSNADNRNGVVTGYPAANPPTGYPATATPPPCNPHFYNYPPTGRPTAGRGTCISGILAFAIVLILLFGAVTFIGWIVLRTNFPEFQVNSFSISNLTLDSSNNSLASFKSEIRLTARNPNRRMSLEYDRIKATIYCRDEFMSETTVPPFSQETRKETSMTAYFAETGTSVDRSVADAINNKKDGNKVEFNLRITSKVSFVAPGSWTRWRSLRVSCGDLVVSAPTNDTPGTLTGGPPPKCSVRDFSGYLVL